MLHFAPTHTLVRVRKDCVLPLYSCSSVTRRGTRSWQKQRGPAWWVSECLSTLCSTYIWCSGRSLLLPSTPKEVSKRVMAATLLSSFCFLQAVMAKSIIGLPLLWVTQHCIGCSGGREMCGVC